MVGRLLGKMVLPVLLVLAFVGCGEPAPAAGGALAVAGLPPVAYLAQRLTGGAPPVKSALPEGRSPHDFAPHPADVRAIAGAKLYFSTGMPFEQAVARSLRNGKVKIVDVTRGIRRLPLTGGGCDGHDHSAHAHAGEADVHHHDGDGGADLLDPHVWLSPENCRIIAGNLLAALCEADPANAELYRRSFVELDRELAEAGQTAATGLAPYRGRSFFVYHPAFGYFAAANGLTQHGIELGGREPSPARLAEVIRAAREHGVKTIFVQPQFNPASARALAEAIHGEVVELDPLARDVMANFRLLTDKIAGGFQHK